MKSCTTDIAGITPRVQRGKLQQHYTLVRGSNTKRHLKSNTFTTFFFMYKNVTKH